MEQKNSTEVSIGLGILEGQLNMARESLAYLYNRSDNVQFRLEIVDITQSIQKMAKADGMHLGKLSYDQADRMKVKIKKYVEKLALYKRNLPEELLPYVGRAVANLNEAKDVLNEVITEITTADEAEITQEKIARQAAVASMINQE